MPDFETLECTVDGRIGRLKLNRPENLNPLSTQCLEELVAAAAWFNDLDDVRVGQAVGAGDLGASRRRVSRSAAARRVSLLVIAALAGDNVVLTNKTCIGVLPDSIDGR